MKITDIRFAAVRKTYDGSARNTLHTWTGRTYLFVGIDTDEGTSGIGEMYCDESVSPAAVELIVRDEIKPALLGRDPRAIAQTRKILADRLTLSGRSGGLAPLMAAVDIASWDLLGKALGTPVRQLLGGFSDRVSVYGSGGMFGPSITPESLGREMADAVARGLGGVKIKARGGTLAEDVARAAAVRAAIGPDARLMVDAMFTANVPDAIRLAKALAPYDLHFLEAPTATADLRGWLAVRDAVGIPLAGPEVESNIGLMRDFMVADAVHFLQYDVALAGGISDGRDLAALASTFRRPVTLHCATAAVGLAASAHLGAAVPNCDSLEYHLMHQGLHHRLWKSGWAIEKGFLVIPDRPGLGLDFTFDDLASGAIEP